MNAKHRIMLLGAGGQVGQALRHCPLPADWELGAYDHARLDIANASALRDAVRDFKPVLIINAAAMTAVDKAEKDPDGARAANFEGPAILASQCSTRDIPLIHLSTDYVFDGRQDRPCLPDDAMNPLNVYGESKMLGEEAIRHEHSWHVILRVSWVFSAFGRNLLPNTLKMIDERDELRMVTDQTGGPTPALDVARALVVIGKTLLDGKSGCFGTFHYCGAPPCSRYALTKAIMEAYAPYTSRRPKISPTVSAAFASFARRPSFSALDCTKTEAVFGLPQPSWRQGLAEAMDLLMTDRSVSA